MKKQAILLILFLAASSSATRVGVVVDLPGQVYTKCVTVAEDADAYEVLGETDLDLTWKYYSFSLGHGLCKIEDVGCPSSNCFCDSTKYWGFYTKKHSETTWSYSPVGFDGGASCSEHYCAENGDIIGLAYGVYGTTPTEKTFSDICCSLPGDEKPCNTITITEVIDYIGKWRDGKATLREIIDLITAWVNT